MKKIFQLCPVFFSKLGIFGECIGCDKKGLKVFQQISENGEKFLTTINTKTGKIVKTIKFIPQEVMCFYKSRLQGTGHRVEVIDYQNKIRKDITHLIGDGFTRREKVSRIMDSDVILNMQCVERKGNIIGIDSAYPLGNRHMFAEYEIKNDKKVRHLCTIPSGANLKLFNVCPKITRI